MTSTRPRPTRVRARLHVVLLAGGSGTRFWPLSRERRPKQFLRFDGQKSLLRAAWDRARRLAPATRIWLVAPPALKQAIVDELPRLRADRFVVEPAPRDTAPAIALACAAIARRDPSAVIAVFPTDHVIQDDAAFAAAIGVATRAAERGALVCLGIAPHHPATGFGYLKTEGRPRRGASTRVLGFVEKPTAARARRFVRSGRYLWNAGIFVWTARRFLDELARVAPDVHGAALAALQGSRRPWNRLERVSVDYAVMEKASDVTVVPLLAGWDDLGSWDAAARLRPPERTARGTRVVIASPGSVVFGGERMVALVGVPDVVVVDTPDALLVTSRSGGEAMRAVVRAVKQSGRKDLT